MTIRVRDYIRNDIEDAGRMAAMFNTWDSVWPGGFTRGVPETAQTILEFESRRRNLAVCVAEDTDTGALVATVIWKRKPDRPKPLMFRCSARVPAIMGAEWAKCSCARSSGA